MDGEGTVRLYERTHAAGLVDDIIRPGGLELTDHLVDLAGLKPDSVVVDLGCGPGASADHLRRGRHFSVVGLDRSDALLRAARDRTIAPLIRADGGRLPLGDSTVDAVLAECSLSLMEDLDGTLAEIHRVLRPGGRLLCSDIYARNPGAAAALRSLPFESCVRGAIGRDKMVATVSRQGFEVLHWEDRSQELRSFAAQLVWRGGSMRTFWCRNGAADDPDAVAAAMTQARPGYYVMIARASNE